MLVLPFPPEHTFLLRILLLLHIGRQPAQDCFGGCGTAATDTGDTGTAPTGGFDPTLLKDFGFFKQIGGGGTRRLTDPGGSAALLSAYGESHDRW